MSSAKGAVILDCGCTNYLGNTGGAQYQDARYGKGKRVFCLTSKEGVARCTVCGTEKSFKEKKEKGEKSLEGK